MLWLWGVGNGKEFVEHPLLLIKKFLNYWVYKHKIDKNY